MIQLCGWHDRPADVAVVAAAQPYPNFYTGAAASGIQGLGRNKKTLLYNALYKAVGGKANWHARLQTIGDCVSMGSAGAVDILRALQFIMGLSGYTTETATEPIYGFSRIDIGKGQLGNQDGSVGAWAAEAVKRLGTLVRAKYGNVDLSVYDGNRAKEYGLHGCPEALKPEAHQHLVKTTSLVTTWEELCDSIAAGYPVTVASNVGFTNVRDAKGFLRPSGSWPHQMVFTAADDESGRPGANCQNSWGDNWVTGPIQFDQPPGSFWVDAEVVARMLAAQDAWAYSDLEGYPAKPFDLGDIF